MEYFPVTIRSRTARNNSLRIYPVSNACGANGISEKEGDFQGAAGEQCTSATKLSILDFVCAGHTDLFFTQISGRIFLPELRGEVHPETAPLQDLCCDLCSTEQSTFRGEKQGEKAPRKGRKGGPTEGQKGKKDAYKQVSIRRLVWLEDTYSNVLI